MQILKNFTLFNFTLYIFLFNCFFIFFLCLKKRMEIGHCFKIISIAGEKRKIHKIDTPLTAAVSIIIILILWSLYYLILNYYDDALLIIVSCSVIIFFIGMYDDRNDLGPYLKIFLIGAIFLIFSNLNEIFILKKIFFASFNKEFYFGKYLKIFITIFCLLLLINALNLADGINGLANMLTTIWLTYLVSMNNNYLNSFFLLPLFFILINNYYIYKGKYFLGDSGSLFFSSIVGMMAIYNYNTALADNKLIPVENIFIIFMIPGFDMFRLFVERILKKKDPFKADNTHLHHFLIYLFSLRQTLFIYFVLVLLPIIASEFLDLNKILIIITSAIIYLTLIIFLKYFLIKKKDKEEIV